MEYLLKKKIQYDLFYFIVFVQSEHKYNVHECTNTYK